MQNNAQIYAYINEFSRLKNYFRFFNFEFCLGLNCINICRLMKPKISKQNMKIVCKYWIFVSLNFCSFCYSFSTVCQSSTGEWTREKEFSKKISIWKNFLSEVNGCRAHENVRRLNTADDRNTEYRMNIRRDARSTFSISFLVSLASPFDALLQKKKTSEKLSRPLLSVGETKIECDTETCDGTSGGKWNQRTQKHYEIRHCRMDCISLHQFCAKCNFE